ncbi:MAG: hypothetical protein EHM72_18160, partial [Calditrichaeota bacterium]
MKKILIFSSILLLIACSSSRKLTMTAERPQYRPSALNHVIDGAIMELLDNPKEALFQYHQAAEIDSTSPGIFITMAEDYYMLQEPEVSIRLAKKALRLDPDNLDARYILALSYEATKQYDQALSIYQQIVKMRPHDIESLYYLTSLQVIAGKPKDAMKNYKKMLRSGFDDPQYL